MNVYEAYLAIKDGKIIRAQLPRESYFVLKTIEIPINYERYIKIDIDDAKSPDKCPKQIGDIDSTELESVCIKCFEDQAVFKVVSLDEVMKECQKAWHDENDED